MSNDSLIKIDKNEITIENETNVRIQKSEVPEIKMKEVVIKQTGNFLNLREKIINIPIEMIVFPFFTPQKQNKRVNFKYSFRDMGVTMYCTLVAKDSLDVVYQPSIFEEKIYMYLISMYEQKVADSDYNLEMNEYIEFEISDFIVNFLGNKMNRNYYSKVEQALKNLKSTQYQFTVSNHTKIGKYRFEDEEFKLLNYQKLKRSRKVFYRVTLNKNIRTKLKEKRYIKYNSKKLLEIISKDPIAGRIYKYISKIRYEKTEDTINIRKLAAIIPLQTEQVTERINKSGDIKQYVLSRIKQVVKRIDKAFQVLVDLEYIERYAIEEEKAEDTFYIRYKFNSEADGSCHVSTYIETKPKQPKQISWNKDFKADVLELNENVEIEEFSTKDKSVEISDKTRYEGLSDKVVEKINLARRNRFVNNNWNKRVENKLRKIVSDLGEEMAIKVLSDLRGGLQTEIKTTLVKYINGMLFKIKEKEKAKKSSYNLRLFGSMSKDKLVKKKQHVNKKRQTPKIVTIDEVFKETNKEISMASTEKRSKEILEEVVEIDQRIDIKEKKLKNKEFANFDKIEEAEIIEESNIKEDRKENRKDAKIANEKIISYNLDDITLNTYDDLKIFEDKINVKLEDKALDLCSKNEGVEKSFLLTLKSKSTTIYFNTIKKYVLQLLGE